MFLHLIIFYIRHNRPKILQNIALKVVIFLFLWGFKMQAKMCLMLWGFGNLAFESFVNIFKEFLRTLWETFVIESPLAHT